jgi:hypothetical protein
MSVLEQARETVTGVGTAIAARGIDAATKVSKRIDGTPAGTAVQRATSTAATITLNAVGAGAAVLQRVRRRTQGTIQEHQAPLADAATVVPPPTRSPIVDPATITPEAPVLPADELPIEDFDHLTLGSLRARLARLDAVELGQLLAYERAHANRANVMTMLENRIAKVRATA